MPLTPGAHNFSFPVRIVCAQNDKRSNFICVARHLTKCLSLHMRLCRSFYEKVISFKTKSMAYNIAIIFA